MICAQHDWWDEGPCPKCVSVTATVTDPLDIPPFLKRSKNDPPLAAEAWDKTWQGAMVAGGSPEYAALSTWTDAELLAALEGDLSISDKQPIYREIHTREEKRKARERIIKMKETMAAKKVARNPK